MSNPYETPKSPFGPQSAYPPPQLGSSGALSIAALVCGILSIIFAICCGILSLPLSIAAIITGAMGLKSPQRGIALAGLICGVVGLLIGIGVVILGIALHVSQLPQ
jgi:hypothetical protein